MKIFVAALFSLLIVCAATAQATPISREQANEYYKTCMATTNPALRPDSLATLCACTSARVMTMTAEDLASTDVVARHKILTEVYAPCTETIAAEMIDYQCISNQTLDDVQEGFDIAKVCSCSGQKSADWYRGKSKNLMQEILQNNPDVRDPARALLDHPLMKSQMLNNIVACSATPPKSIELPAPAAAP